MKLNVRDRIIIRANYNNYKTTNRDELADILNNLSKKINFTNEEEKKYEIKYTNNNITFNPSKDEEIEVELDFDTLCNLFNKYICMLTSRQDFVVLSKIFSEIKDDIEWNELKEIKLNDINEFEKSKSHLYFLLGISTGDEQSWMEYVKNNNITIEDIKSVVKYLSFLNIENIIEKYNATIKNEDGNPYYAWDGEIDETLKVPKEVEDDIISLVDKVGINITQYKDFIDNLNMNLGKKEDKEKNDS